MKKKIKMVFKRLISLVVLIPLTVLVGLTAIVGTPFYWIITGKELEEWNKTHTRWYNKIFDWQTEFVKEK